ncbi:MAG: hypothetical protein MSD82_07195 [Prevotella sp.]|nr:hypothetical protein [Prevotella sp.]
MWKKQDMSREGKKAEAGLVPVCKLDGRIMPVPEMGHHAGRRAQVPPRHWRN